MVSSPGTKNAKTARPKRIPQRMCVVCRESNAKRTLTRIVRTGEESFEADPTGRANGRGAYVCDKAGCWDKVLATPILARALRVTPNSESTDRLKEFAAGLNLDAGENDTTVDSKESAI